MDYLAALGVTAWQLRSEQTQLTLKLPLYKEAILVGCVIMANSLSSETRDLLNKIVATLGCTVGDTVEYPEGKPIKSLVVTFGIYESSATINLPGLDEMLVEPALKRQAWQVLKNYLNLAKI